ncbi:MAG: SPASM domain-containing protein [Candidatus Omnitrophota bacterium]
MRIRNNLKRAFNFLGKRHREILTREFWMTIARVYSRRLRYHDRVSTPEFLWNLKQIEIRPWNLHIEATNICNANCIFCAYQFQARERKVMDDALYSKALMDYCAMGGGELRIESCVGDPLVDPHFLARVKEARSHPEIKQIVTLTNGINLDRIGIEDLLRSGINRIRISTGPWDEKLYSLAYRSLSYQRMRDNVTELIRKNAELGEPVEIEVLFRSNLSMKKTLQLSDYQAIRNLPHKVEFNTDFDTWLDNIHQDDLLSGMHIRPLCDMEKEPCYLLYDGPTVFVDGKIGLCGCRDFNANSELIIGNIHEASLSDLWQSEATRGLRERFFRGDFPSICRKCRGYANLDYYRSREGSLRARLIKEWLGKVKQ